MESAELQRGNCRTCRQRRVLGCWLHNEAGEASFRCCACLDEHGDGEVAADATAEEPQQDPDCAANWWACSEPPAHLRDVPEGFLLTSDWDLGARTDKPFTTVCDPDHCYFSGLGAERVWAAGLALARHLWQWSWSGSPSVVELGAGCGLPGMVLARRGARVTLTDVPWLLQLMEYNIEANFLEDDPSRPSVASLRWGSREDLRELQKDVGVPDLVVGADLVYREQDFDALLSTIASLKPRHALLAVRRRDRILEEFMRFLTQMRWGACSCMIAPHVYLLELTPPSTSAAALPTCTLQAASLRGGIGKGCQAAAAA